MRGVLPYSNIYEEPNKSGRTFRASKRERERERERERVSE
jgi:hypothetical protein